MLNCYDGGETVDMEGQLLLTLWISSGKNELLSNRQTHPVEGIQSNYSAKLDSLFPWECCYVVDSVLVSDASKQLTEPWWE